MDVHMAKGLLAQIGAREPKTFTDPELAVQYAASLYEDAVDGMNTAFRRYKSDGKGLPFPNAQAYYPLFAVPIPEHEPEIESSAAYGFCHVLDRLYVHTASRIKTRARYLVENLGRVMEAHQAPVLVGVSNTAIPLEFAVNLEEEGFSSPAAGDPESQPVQTDSEEPPWFNNFTRMSYGQIIKAQTPPQGLYYLSPYDALLLDYFWEALRHYTGTDPADYQRFVVLFNYRRYEKEIARMADLLIQGTFEELVRRQDNTYTEFVRPEGLGVNDSAIDSEWQMPAYHLKNPAGGITFVNIGVGAPSAVTFAEAVCALRPDLVQMAGHCAGTARTHKIGNFVLASSFSSYCGATRFELPTDMPVESLGEHQSCGRLAIKEVFQVPDAEIDLRAESGNLTSVDYRHWVIRAQWYSLLAHTQAAIVDMEGAEVARTCKGNHTPYGFIGMITDVPPYDRPKLRGPAQRLLAETKEKFVLVPFRTCELLRDGMAEGRMTPHSRKIRPKYFPPGDLTYRYIIPYPFA